ncbi:7720_t:CDS:2 [Funneliformis geosporum]|uniref:7720_t:CDS:1 n=1 Tax=Funneliformis geosporum TaxID=1117311 RepID=A0A9W4SWZ3_9GLOM|nr:7720_t:CDS:2 [Funneliformis geosporum]
MSEIPNTEINIQSVWYNEIQGNAVTISTQGSAKNVQDSMGKGLDDNKKKRNKEDAKEKEDQSIFLVGSNSSHLQKQIDITPKRKLDDVEEDDDIYDNFEIVISDIILIVRKTDVRVKMEEWLCCATTLIDTISSSATNARCLFEDIWDTMVIAMEEVTSISITKDDKIKNCAKESSWMWGETALKCSSILLNKSQRDDDRRSPSSKIDTIIKLMELNLEFSVVENKILWGFPRISQD